MEASEALNEKDTKRKKVKQNPYLEQYPDDPYLLKNPDAVPDEANRFFVIKLNDQPGDKSEPEQVSVGGGYGPRPQRVAGKNPETDEEYQKYLETKPPWARTRGNLSRFVLQRNVMCAVPGHVVVRLKDSYRPKYKLITADQNPDGDFDAMVRLPNSTRFPFQQWEITEKGYKALLAKVRKDPKFEITEDDLKKYMVL